LLRATSSSAPLPKLHGLQWWVNTAVRNGE
jgi:hypothetical protein